MTTIHVKRSDRYHQGSLVPDAFSAEHARGGGKIILRGRVTNRKGGLAMEHPEIFYPVGKYEEKIHTLQPVYGLTAGLSNNIVAKAMHQALSQMDLDP